MLLLINLYIAVCVCECMAATETSIKWDVKTKYVTYGEDTTLTCNANTCSPYSSKQWFGGPAYDLLCSDDYTANPYKYEMVVESTSPNFDLMIKNFTFSDADCKYTCVCGLLHFTKMLTLDSLDFIYPPVLKENSQEATENKFQIDLLMKVYPLPNCNIIYQEINIPLKITNYTKTYNHTGCCTLYDIRIRQIVDINVSCSGMINLTCKVADRNYTLTEKKNVDSCRKVPISNVKNADQATPINTVELIGILALMCLLVLGVTILLLISVKKRRRLLQAEAEMSVQLSYRQPMMLG